MPSGQLSVLTFNLSTIRSTNESINNMRLNTDIKVISYRKYFTMLLFDWKLLLSCTSLQHAHTWACVSLLILASQFSPNLFYVSEAAFNVRSLESSREKTYKRRHPTDKNIILDSVTRRPYPLAFVNHTSMKTSLPGCGSCSLLMDRIRVFWPNALKRIVLEFSIWPAYRPSETGRAAVDCSSFQQVHQHSTDWTFFVFHWILYGLPISKASIPQLFLWTSGKNCFWFIAFLTLH